MEIESVGVAGKTDSRVKKYFRLEVKKNLNRSLQKPFEYLVCIIVFEILTMFMCSLWLKSKNIRMEIWISRPSKMVL